VRPAAIPDPAEFPAPIPRALAHAQDQRQRNPPRLHPRARRRPLGRVKVSHVKPGKGGAFAQVELKNIRDGRKLNERFRSADKVERVRLDQKDQQFLYESEGLLHFMDAETFEQVTIPADILGDRRPFLQDGMTIQVEYYEDEALNAQLPDKVTCTVVETEPAVKGQTAANSFKPAVLDNGVRRPTGG
jgi:elongation factor P